MKNYKGVVSVSGMQVAEYSPSARVCELFQDFSRNSVTFLHHAGVLGFLYKNLTTRIKMPDKTVSNVQGLQCLLLRR